MTKYLFNNCEFCYYFRPGKSYDENFNNELYQQLVHLNNKSHNFKFGLFDPQITSEKFTDIFSNIILCLIKHNNELIGFFYFFILNEKYERPLIQLGLIVIVKNPGFDVFGISEKIGLLYAYKKFGYFNSAIITTIPKIVEEFCLTYSHTWPNPQSNLSRAPEEYKKYLIDVGDIYIKTFFPKSFKINKKRFTLILDKRESGFHDRFHYLPMAKKFSYNSFCRSWINYEENEDLILIGKYDFWAYLKTKIYIYKKVLLWNFQDKISLLKMQLKRN